MDLVSVARVARRRWQVVVAGVAATCIAVIVLLVMPPTYEATSVLVLLAPSTPPPATSPTGSVPAAINPYQAFDSSIAVTAGLMATQLTQPGVVDRLARRGATPDYTVTTDPDSGGPTVTITAKDRNADTALRTTRLVSTEFRRQLAASQVAAGAPKGSLISASVVTAPTHADRLVSGRNRALVAVLAIGLVISICAALAVDTLLTHYARQYAERNPAPPPPRRGAKATHPARASARTGSRG